MYIIEDSHFWESFFFKIQYFIIDNVYLNEILAGNY